MAKGIALTIGLNAVDPAHYAGWDGELNACEADATDMHDIATAQGFEAKALLTKQATRRAVKDAMTATAKGLHAGDTFLLTYSGHGGQLPDLNGEEDDGQDETWCLFDGELVDDELYSYLAKFEPGVRIFVLSDSCHSGTVTKAAFYASRSRENPELYAAKGTPAPAKAPVYRVMPPDIALRTYQKNKALYDSILSDKDLKGSRKAVKASVVLISGCQDNQLSQDGTFNGLFTGTLRRVWNGGKYKKKGYHKFQNAIVQLMPPDQTPNYFVIGTHNAEFEMERPFTV